MKNRVARMVKLPSLNSIGLVVLSVILMTAAFPGFEVWQFAWVGLIPLIWAVENESGSMQSSFLIGWIWGTLFFFSTCWWLTHAPITYAGVPTLIAYVLLLGATAVAGLFAGGWGILQGSLVSRFSRVTVLATPAIWMAFEYARLWLTGNNWNSIGYSQAFNSTSYFASIGGVFLVGFLVVASNAVLYIYLRWISDARMLDAYRKRPSIPNRIAASVSASRNLEPKYERAIATVVGVVPAVLFLFVAFGLIALADYGYFSEKRTIRPSTTNVIAVQPNVPMSGLDLAKWKILRTRQAQLAEFALRNPDLKNLSRRQAGIDALPDNLAKRGRFYEELALEAFRNGSRVVIFPESPMNFQYSYDAEFRAFLKSFASRNGASVLFNSAEPDKSRKNGFFNSAVLVDKAGEKVIQYDKIHLLPFGEFVPLPGALAQLVPPMVGRFSHGTEYDLLPIGDSKAGVMICFESHFPSLSREYVRNGADVLIELTNDGYLGNTPVLRQHLASAVFRAVETNRPVLRVTNVGVTAYIDGTGEIVDEAGVYQEAIRVWPVSPSDGSKTIYVSYGDWFAWLCSIASLGLLFLCFFKR